MPVRKRVCHRIQNFVGLQQCLACLSKSSDNCQHLPRLLEIQQFLSFVFVFLLLCFVVAAAVVVIFLIPCSCNSALVSSPLLSPFQASLISLFYFSGFSTSLCRTRVAQLHSRELFSRASLVNLTNLAICLSYFHFVLPSNGMSHLIGNMERPSFYYLQYFQHDGPCVLGFLAKKCMDVTRGSKSSTYDSAGNLHT